MIAVVRRQSFGFGFEGRLRGFATHGHVCHRVVRERQAPAVTARYPAAVLTPLAVVVEALTPARLGRSFRWLLSASVVTNAGDGVALAAGPLLIASQTRDPLLVSMALLAQTLPQLLFGVVAGAITDRHDRRRIVIAVNLGRALVLAVLTATIATGIVNIAVVLAALFVLGSAETFADVGSSSLLPRLVRREDLGIANARLQGAFLLLSLIHI